MDVKNINPFMESFTSIMPQLGFSEIRKGTLSVKNKELVSSGILILVGIVGGIKGNVAYSLDLESAKQVASKMMMGMPVDELGEMEKSALSELSNMLTASAVTLFSSIGVLIDISTPTLLQGDSISLKMGTGQILCVQLFADDIPIEINIAFNA
ncbi:MAG TPA: chemotaxis protein CheX [Epulopiscium sp.]|nr:chemotaxis protein CheX [Candidatus Epulonipiscium sp.]